MHHTRYTLRLVDTFQCILHLPQNVCMPGYHHSNCHSKSTYTCACNIIHSGWNMPNRNVRIILYVTPSNEYACQCIGVWHELNHVGWLQQHRVPWQYIRRSLCTWGYLVCQESSGCVQGGVQSAQTWGSVCGLSVRHDWQLWPKQSRACEDKDQNWGKQPYPCTFLMHYTGQYTILSCVVHLFLWL